MKKFCILLFFVLFSNLIIAQNIPLPELISPVTDLTNTLTQSEIDLIENKLYDFEMNNNGQVVVLMISSTGNEVIEEYSIRLAEYWKIGSEKNDDGVILLIAKDDRQLRIEVGYGLEGIITDADAKQIIDEIIVTEFKNGDFFAGINNGIDAITGLIKGEPLPVTNYEDYISKYESYSDLEEDSYTFNGGWFVVSILFSMAAMIVPFFFLRKRGILFFVIMFIILTGCSALFGHLADGEYFSSILFSIMSGFTIIIIIILKTVAHFWAKKNGKDPSDFFAGGSGSYTGSSSSWSSSSSYSSWGSSSGYSSGSSGYSGGGGSFGGGGASGSW